MLLERNKHHTDRDACRHHASENLNPEWCLAVSNRTQMQQYAGSAWLVVKVKTKQRWLIGLPSIWL